MFTYILSDASRGVYNKMVNTPPDASRASALLVSRYLPLSVAEVFASSGVTDKAAFHALWMLPAYDIMSHR